MLYHPFRMSPRIAILLLALAAPAFAQLDLTGVWLPVFHEDQPERIPGPSLVDYLGLPINDSARKWALAWDPDRLTAQEHQCQVHTAAYIFRGPLLLRIWEERDPQTQNIVAIHMYSSTYEQNRVIWMDGRPHPAGYAPHTWMGFSTGKWEGKTLVIETTMLLPGWLDGSGYPMSGGSDTRIVERWTPAENGLTMERTLTVYDKLYTQPITRTRGSQRGDAAAVDAEGACHRTHQPVDQRAVLRA